MFRIHTEARDQWSTLLRELWPQLIRYLLSRGLSQADAEDLVADTLESVFRRFKGDYAALIQLPKQYYVTVLRHKQVDRFRAGIGHREYPSENLFYRETPEEESLYNRLEQELLRLTVQQAIQALTKDQRTVVELFYHKELTLREIARQLGKTEAAVTSLLDRARKALGKALEKEVRDK